MLVFVGMVRQGADDVEGDGFPSLEIAPAVNGKPDD
jgi:hypothetical protein